MPKQHDRQFKTDAIEYYQNNKDLGLEGCAKNLGIGSSTLSKWLKPYRESGSISVRGFGNYASDKAKEITQLKRALRDTKDDLDVLKSYWHSKLFYQKERKHGVFTSTNIIQGMYE